MSSGLVFAHIVGVKNKHVCPYARVQLARRDGTRSEMQNVLIPSDQVLEFRVDDREDVLEFSILHGHEEFVGSLVLPVRCVRPNDVGF